MKFIKNSLLVASFLGAMTSSAFALDENNSGFRSLSLDKKPASIADTNSQVKKKPKKKELILEEKCKSRGDDVIFFSGNEKPLVSAPSCDLKRSGSSADELNKKLKNRLDSKQENVFGLPIFYVEVKNGKNSKNFEDVPILKNGKLNPDLTESFTPKNKDSIEILGYTLSFDEITVGSKSFEGPNEIKSLMKVDNDSYITELANLVSGQIGSIQEENPNKKIGGLEFQINNNHSLSITDITEEGLKTFFKENDIGPNLKSDTYKVGVVFEKDVNGQKEENFYKFEIDGIKAENGTLFDSVSDIESALKSIGDIKSFEIVGTSMKGFNFSPEDISLYVKDYLEKNNILTNGTNDTLEIKIETSQNEDQNSQVGLNSQNNIFNQNNDKKYFTDLKTKDIDGIKAELFAILDITSDKKPELIYKGTDGNFYVTDIRDKHSKTYEFLGYETGCFFERSLDLLIYRTMIQGKRYIEDKNPTHFSEEITADIIKNELGGEILTSFDFFVKYADTMKSEFAVEKKKIRDPTDDNKITYKDLRKIAIGFGQSKALGEAQLQYAISQGVLVSKDVGTVAYGQGPIDKAQGILSENIFSGLNLLNLTPLPFVDFIADETKGLNLDKSYKTELNNFIVQNENNLSGLAQSVKSFTESRIQLEPDKGIFSGLKNKYKRNLGVRK